MYKSFLTEPDDLSEFCSNWTVRGNVSPDLSQLAKSSPTPCSGPRGRGSLEHEYYGRTRQGCGPDWDQTGKNKGQKHTGTLKWTGFWKAWNQTVLAKIRTTKCQFLTWRFEMIVTTGLCTYTMRNPFLLNKSSVQSLHNQVHVKEVFIYKKLWGGY